MSPLVLAFALALVIALLSRTARADTPPAVPAETPPPAAPQATPPPPPAAAQIDAARYAAVAAEMRALAGPSFTVIVEPPYVVAGDGGPAAVRRRAEGTVRWSHEKLRAQFFAKDPTEPVRVWLFRDDTSYVKHVRAWLGETPDTPYGFAGETGLYMNISTGGGTLIHEMVHPLVDTNIRDCPPWFNEGLASLFEHAAEQDGRIVGRVNWRLRGLKAGIRNGAVPPFEELLAMDHEAFYRDPAGVHYGTSRYLMYYLQQEGLLQRYTALVGSTRGADPTGLAALKTVLGRDDLVAFQAKWTAWVMALEG
jgi:hypothetical protein